jgi:phosphopantothenate---cysteine ligase (CTP)
MRVIVTAGPTFEPLDGVRRLTNFSTGRLGCELADYLTAREHEVDLLVGQQATYRGERRAKRVHEFTTTGDLRDRLHGFRKQPIDAIFHAAAVSDFAFGKVWLRSPDGQMTEVKSAKIATRDGSLVAELVPTPKILTGLREVFPTTKIIGWKFEMEGDRATVVRLAERQLTESRSNACVANGSAYGDGFGLVTTGGTCLHLADKAALFPALEQLL